MTQGSISKLVTSYGSTWGRIQPAGESREVFFNQASFDEAVEFLSLVVGQGVEFQERDDRVNGSHAEHVLLVSRPSEQGRRVVEEPAGVRAEVTSLASSPGSSSPGSS
jgi:hypothetical protein